MKKTIVIVSASTGYGHNQVAGALKLEFEEKGYKAVIVEPLKEVSKSLDMLVSDGYKILATLMPKMYGTIYKISNNETMNKPVAKIFIKALRDKIEEIVNLDNASMIISTHPLLVDVISSLKGDGIINIPFLSIITDFLPHQSYISDNVDAYLVGSSYTKNGIVARGISPDKVYCYGIPIKRIFREDIVTEKKEDIFTILLMGGSMGVNSIKKALKNLLNIEDKLKIIVVCGNNDTLKNSLDEKYNEYIPNKYIEILGFTDKIPELMELSDVIITKPGGLTVTEALTKNIPMIIPYFIPGQEEENAEVLVNAGAAIKVDSVKELDEVVGVLMNDPSKIKWLKQNMKEMSKDHSIEKTINLCFELMEEYKPFMEIIKDAN
ncbi:MGDG synthase family glycosyltransferase [Vallitalea sp.]|jgi:processive 1,2-diacylglycerol beta-glucosyltransferase|uniref:MGDG synthase family glycosyltransferase n=1 Tax=Vallitalea sp. TaxID=1882829 RepID=UPI0025F1A20E|nr:glycosyltransferase [Vallitalea sp.]MCT4686460.1 glycosyltransferase [Vallitalea sp.]